MPNHTAPQFQEGTTPPDFFKTLAAVSELEEGEISKIEAHVNIPTEQPILIAWMSDLHCFSRYTDHDAIGAHLRMIKETDGAYVAFGGDLIDHGGRHGLSGEDRLSLDEQTRALKAMLDHMKDKTIVAVSGNHELFSQDMNDDPANVYMAGQSAPYFRVGGVVSLKVGEQDYKLLLHHKGKGGGTTPTAKNRKIAELWCPTADIVVSGHTHRAAFEEAYRNEGRHRHKVTYVTSGTYKTGHDVYAMGNGYTSGEPGGICTILWPDEKRTMTIMDMEQAIETLRFIREHPRARKTNLRREQQ
jgi:predicted phosphodiesterase